MRHLTLAAMLMVGAAFVQPFAADAQNKAGGIIVEYNDIDIALVADGWSVVELLRGNVYNDLGEFVGYVHDAIVTPDGETTFIIVNVAGFLNIGEKLVALPSMAFDVQADGDLLLANATKDGLKALPQFIYAKN